MYGPACGQGRPVRMGQFQPSLKGQQSGAQRQKGYALVRVTCSGRTMSAALEQYLAVGIGMLCSFPVSSSESMPEIDEVQIMGVYTSRRTLYSDDE